MSSISYELTDLQKEEFKEVFDLFDQDGDGFIQQKELGVSLRTLGYNPSSKELEELDERIDDEEKRISFAKFLEMMTVFLDKKRNEDEIDDESLMKGFQNFQPNSEGLVSLSIIKKDFKSLADSIGSPKYPVFDHLLHNPKEDDILIDFESFKKMFGYTS